MDIVCLVVSKQLFSDEKTMAKVMSMVQEYPRETTFVSDLPHLAEKIRDMGMKFILYFPFFAMYRRKSDAYDDRAKRMVEYATHFRGYLDEKDAGLTLVMAAIEFTKQHPGYFMSLVVGDREIKLDELRRRYKWTA